jgi:hypothetical protein
MIPAGGVGDSITYREAALCGYIDCKIFNMHINAIGYRLVCLGAALHEITGVLPRRATVTP